MDNREYLVELHQQILKQLLNGWAAGITLEEDKLYDLMFSICDFIKPLYNEKYDSYYDPVTDLWMSITCGDKDCSFCKDRPLRPSQVSK